MSYLNLIGGEMGGLPTGVNVPWEAAIPKLAGAVAGSSGGSSAGSTGSSIGSLVGTAFGPIGTAVGGVLGGLAGGALGGGSSAPRPFSTEPNYWLMPGYLTPEERRRLPGGAKSYKGPSRANWMDGDWKDPGGTVYAGGSLYGGRIETAHTTTAVQPRVGDVNVSTGGLVELAVYGVGAYMLFRMLKGGRS